MQIENPGRVVYYLQVQRICSEVNVQCDSEGFFKAGKVCKMQTVFFLCLPGWRYINPPFNFLHPLPKKLNSLWSANDTQPDFSGLLRL
jgi:hypothetical protein